MEEAKMPPDKILNPGAKWYLKELDEAPFLDEQIPIAATIYTDGGKMICGLSPKWNEWSDELKAEVLSHEAGHVCGGHDIRGQVMQKNRGEEEFSHKLWNVVCDAAIHYSGGVEPWAVEELHGVTYDSLKIPPVPPEIAYDMLEDKIQKIHVGCGREGVQGRGEQTSAANSRALIASIRGAASMGKLGSNSQSSGRVLPNVAPDYPEWVQEVLARLKKIVSYDEPSRRWVKETRRDVEPILLPGRGPKLGVACTFILDASGSIPDDVLQRFFGAVEATPELSNSELVVFSDRAVGPLPVRQSRELVEKCGGGGTSFQAGAKLRRPGIPVVWLTDGYTGDGWPTAHDTDELWVITTEVEPPHGVKVQA